MPTIHLQYESDVTALGNALQVAASQYDRDAENFDRFAKEGGKDPMGIPACQSLARQFRDQAVTARRLVREIDEQT